MALPNVFDQLPAGVIPQGLAGACGYREQVSAVLFEQQRAANLAHCRMVTSLYCLYRACYADAEQEYLALGPGTALSEFTARKRDLRLRETELSAQASVLLRTGPAATERALEEAVGFVERLPRIFGLIARNVISVRVGQEALRRSRVLTGEQAHRFDDALAARLEADPAGLFAVPAVREAADKIVLGIDPAAARRRRERARTDRTVIFRPEDDGMAAAYALLVAEDALELAARVDEISGTVCDRDSRTAAQRRADGLMMLVRGYVSLGCDCGICQHTEPRTGAAAGAGARTEDGVLTRYRTLMHVVVNERTLTDPGNTEPALIVGHGPITADHARDLATRPDTITRDLGHRITEPPEPADQAAAEPAGERADAPTGERAGTAEPVDEPTSTQSTARPAGDALVTARGSGGYRLTADLARYLTALYPRCVFPLCTRPAHRCQIDHSREYCHTDPTQGGRTEVGNLQPLCTTHHQLKTAGSWIDTRLPDGRIMWTSPDGTNYTVDPAALTLDLFPDLRRIHWDTPQPQSPGNSPEPSVPPAPPSRLQREHQRRQRIRRENIAAYQARRRPKTTTARRSDVEDRLRVLITAHAAHRHAQERALAVGGRGRLPQGPLHRRKRQPPHPDEPEPPF